MNKISVIWETLEESDSFTNTMLLKRYSAEVIPDIFVALKSPEKIRCIAFGIDMLYKNHENTWNTFKEIKIEFCPNEGGTSKYFLLIQLLDKQHSDIFSTLCEDLIFNVSKQSDEKALVNQLINRLSKWNSLFEKAGKQGLTDEARKGLYGEIYFLRLLINQSFSKERCVRTWLGPEKAAQDFQFQDWAVEVKTSTGKKHQKIYISNERQLDDLTIDHLFLYHLTLEERLSNGETLNFLIDDVKLLLKDEHSAINFLNMKLFEYGYFDEHKHQYEEQGYFVRNEHICHVHGRFPRITENNIPAGVGDVKYSIMLSDTNDWKVSREFLFTKISF